jgi:hypothetical protein
MAFYWATSLTCLTRKMITATRAPCWTPEQVALYKKWMDGGFQP